MKKILKITTLFLLIATLIGFSFTIYLYVSTKNYTFEKDKLTKDISFLTFYDKNNNELKINKNSSTFTTEIPNHVKNAFISLEDKRFYSHKGIDFKRTIKALLVNLKNNSFSQGGSTISQQLIKNTHLSNEKTLKRKFIELKLTKQLEKNYSKEEILNFYLNNIYFGENCYGIYNASKRYFDKEPKNLSIAEGAMLAGLVKAPSNYNPIKDINKANSRKKLCLDTMLKNNFITKSQYQNALNEKININTEQNLTNNALFQEINNELKQIFNTPYINKKLKIYTYIDSELQNYISSLNLDEICDKSYIVIDNKTIGVKAYYSTCNSCFRQPASTIKPILVYAPAYQENVVNLQTKILDKKTDFNGYTPKNFNDKYYGYISCKDALSKSLNVPSVKILNSLGIDKCKEYAKKFNIKLTNENLSIALGGLENGITLQHLSSCYSTFANDGNFAFAKFIKEIKNENDVTIYKRNETPIKIFTKETSYLINYNLMDSVKNGTSKKLNGLNYQICAKTGTNGKENGNLDAYSISYTTNDTIGIWLGGKNNKLLSNNCTGANQPTIIAKKIYSMLYKYNQPENFNIPENIIKIKFDKYEYDTNYKIIPTDNFNSYEGIFIKGYEPKITNETNILPFIKYINIKDNIKDFILFYESNNCNGVLIFEVENNKERFLKESTKSQIKIKKNNKISKYKLIPFRYENGKKILGIPYEIPNILISNTTIDWWED